MPATADLARAFKALKISEHVYWVGAIDWSLREFHGYATHRGTTYNAFLIVADEVTLVDTVKAPFMDEMLARVASVTDPSSIRTIVSNHSEMDHSGCLPEVIDVVKPDRVLASKKGADALGEHFGLEGVEAVENGSQTELGGVKVSFITTPMLHWPDSMFTYLHDDELLFAQDGFGMHLASYERWCDELDPAVLEYEAAKYYANILLPYSRQVTRCLTRVGELGLSFSIVAPDHGPLWRGDGVSKAIGWYARWAEQRRSRKGVVVYDTMWKSSELLARAIGEGLHAGGSRAVLMPMDGSHRSDVATELLDAGALVVGSPTINNNIFPTLADVLVYLKGLRPMNLIGAAFGSFGWGGEATRDLTKMLEDMRVELVAEPLKQKYVPDGDDLQRAFDLGRQVAVKLAERVEEA